MKGMPSLKYGRGVPLGGPERPQVSCGRARVCARARPSDQDFLPFFGGAPQVGARIQAAGVRRHGDERGRAARL